MSNPKHTPPIGFNWVIQLKEVAPYLPYLLKFVDSTKETFIVSGHNIQKVVDNPHYKIILRPLSDLIKEIEYDGDKFVPMVELARTAFPKCNKHNLTNDYVDMGLRYTFHIDKKEASFECRRLFNGKKWDESCYVPNQLELFQKLFAWHFDLFGLISKGLAIQKATG